MLTIEITEAQKQLPDLLDAASQGEKVVISQDGNPVAQLVAIRSTSTTRKFGTMKGKIWIADDFDAPLPDEIQAAFDGK